MNPCREIIRALMFLGGDSVPLYELRRHLSRKGIKNISGEIEHLHNYGIIEIELRNKKYYVTLTEYGRTSYNIYKYYLKIFGCGGE